MVKTYYVVMTTNCVNFTKIQGITSKLKKANLLLDKIFDDNKNVLGKFTVEMFRFTCDVVNGETKHKERLFVRTMQNGSDGDDFSDVG